MSKTETVTIGQITFIVAPEEVPTPKLAPQPKQTQRPSAPQCTPDRCTMSSPKLGPDGYYHLNYIADRMWTEKNKKWWQRL